MTQEFNSAGCRSAPGYGNVFLQQMSSENSRTITAQKSPGRYRWEELAAAVPLIAASWLFAEELFTAPSARDTSNTGCYYSRSVPSSYYDFCEGTLRITWGIARDWQVRSVVSPKFCTLKVAVVTIRILFMTHKEIYLWILDLWIPWTRCHEWRAKCWSPYGHIQQFMNTKFGGTMFVAQYLSQIVNIFRGIYFGRLCRS